MARPKANRAANGGNGSTNGSIPARPLRRLTQAELDQFLDTAANILRGNVDHSEFRGYVFALLFFKRISDVYQEEVQILTAALGDEASAKDPKMHIFVVPEECLWETTARKSRNELGTALNEAMIAIERANQPKFDGILTNRVIDFNKQDELPRDKLVNLINHFGKQNFNRAHVSDDVFGNAYEYLIRNFASKAGKSSGEFYTPREVAYLMSEIVEPAPGHSVCDWASGSGGLLLQCRNYVRRHGGDPDRLFLYAQESNISTYNISRINMILHGVKSWQHRQGDSLREPWHTDDFKQMMTFDRIVMNPPFSLEDWGHGDFTREEGNTVTVTDPMGRFEWGMPPRNNGDYAWLQHVVRSLKDDGKAIVVMSQGVLFRGQPEQNEEEDGQNQKADAEYIIREAFVKADIIECVIVLPSKLFYGNNVPGCLIVLNKTKSSERKNQVLLIWASRHFQSSNPQNLLRPSDLMRILVPWRSFGDLERARVLVGEQEQTLIEEEEDERTRRLKDIEDAYAPLIAPLEGLRAELTLLETADFDVWSDAPNSDHPIFGPLAPLREYLSSFEAKVSGMSRSEKPAAQESVRTLKTDLRTRVQQSKKAYKDRVKELTRTIKELEKLQAERDFAESEVNDLADQEIAHLKEAAADLLRICSDPDEAKRYFTTATREEIETNEFNLNLPRYVSTFEPEEKIDLKEALEAFVKAEELSRKTLESMTHSLRALLENGQAKR